MDRLFVLYILWNACVFYAILAGVYVRKDGAIMKKLSGYRALLTGASGGIGRAIAKAFAEEGAILCLSGRHENDLLELQKELAAYQTSIWVTDLSDKEAVTNMPKAIEEKEGPIDILVNNGGMTLDNLALRIKDADWDQVIQVNLTAAFQLAKGVLPSMMKKRWGRIINISSVVALTGNAGQANYVASKAGLIGLTKCLALEVASRNITVNSIAPGFISTAMTKNLLENEEARQKILQKIPCQKCGTPEDIAHGALFLADQQASYITGETIHINGGMGMF